jgi:phosphoribosylanthranilate isomerase
MSKTYVKICGITNLEDARIALQAGADLLGFILYPKSPRYIDAERIKAIVEEIREQEEIIDWRPQLPTPHPPHPTPHPPQPKFVGIFVNEPVEHIAAILDQTGLDYAQLHSDEAPDSLRQLHRRAFKALRPTSHAEALAEAARFAPLGPPTGPALMIDAYDATAYGGTGKVADWHAAAAVAAHYPGLLLAGGLTPDNVTAAIRTVQPWGVDVSSGVERAPGRKDHAKVRAFVAAVKGQV